MSYEVCHTLLEATITLYPVDDAGRPLTAFPIWTGVPADSLAIAERWIKLQNRPAGARQPRNHPLVAQYEISIGRVWALPLADLKGFLSDGERYVLDIAWQDEDDAQWHRKTFYGVTVSERSHASRTVESEFADAQVFEAEYFLPASGTGTIPAIVPDLPYLIKYVSAFGSRFIYSYDPVTHSFTELTANISAVTAVIGYLTTSSALLYRSATLYRNSSPYRETSAFRIRFSGESVDAMQLGADGVIAADSYHAGAPMRDELPRVDFCYGGKRLASVSRNGVLFAWSFETGATAEVAPGFEFFSDTTRLATITPQAVRAAEFV